MMIDRSQVHEGMAVYSSDGEKLGKVQSCDASSFVIEKGFFFPKDYVARYDDVRGIEGDDIHLSMSKDTFQELREGAKGDEGWRAGSISTSGQPRTTDADAMAADYGVDRAGTAMDARSGGEWRGGSSGPTGSEGFIAGSGEGGVLQPGMQATGDLSRTARAQATGDDLRGTASRGAEDVRVPIAEEELDVVKRDRQAGEVRLRKDVVTETKHVEVPVTREEVHVERVAATNRDATDDGKLFQKDTVSVPVHEEEIEVRKRPVVKEEVRLRKERFTEQRAADADVRKERVDVEGDEGTTTRRMDRGEEDLSTTRRIEDQDTGTRGLGEPPTGIIPPRDDT